MLLPLPNKVLYDKSEDLRTRSVAFNNFVLVNTEVALLYKRKEVTVISQQV